MPLTAEEAQLFYEKGYLVKPGLVPAPEVERVRREVRDLDQRLRQRVPPGVVIGWEAGAPPARPVMQQVLHAELVSAAVDRLIDAPALLDVACSLIGPEIGLFQSKLLLKAERVGGALPGHQDFAYWRDAAEAPVQLNCMIYIEDADGENGCLEVIPGSHHGGLRPHGSEAATFGRSIADGAGSEEHPVLVPGPAGTAIFFGPLLVHRSGPNLSDRARPSLTIVYGPLGIASSWRRVVRAPQAAGELPELSHARRFDGPGPHAGQCAGDYRRRELWKVALARVENPGDPWVECGLAAGDSVEWLAARKPVANRLLRFEWWPSTVSNREDVEIVAGPFDQRLRGAGAPGALHARIGLLHIACGAYWQTKLALRGLSASIRMGSVIVFDDLDPSGSGGAARALAELVSERGLGIEWIGRADREAALRIESEGGRVAYRSGALEWTPTVFGIELRDGRPEATQPPGRWRRRWNRFRFGLERRLRDRVLPALVAPGLERFFPRDEIPVFRGEGPPGGHCPTHARRRELWRLALSMVPSPRLPWCEFGVGEGESLDWFAFHKPAGNLLIGFDSFAGIPEPWAGHPAGHWRSPVYRPNRDDVVIVDGMFADVLRRESTRSLLGSQIGLVHVDCDLYSSTIAVLERIGDRLGPGTIIVFDEFYEVPEWYRHEARAWREFVARRRVEFEYLARADYQVLVRVISVGTRASWSSAPIGWQPGCAGIRLEH